MLGWLKKLSKGKLENPEGLSKQKLQSLSDDFSSIEREAKGLSGKLLEYVVDGTGNEVLLKITGKHELALALGLRSFTNSSTGRKQKDLKTRLEFFKDFGSISPNILFRLAQVYAALWSGKSGGRLSWKHLDPSLFWLEVLIKEVAQVDEWGNCPLRYSNNGTLDSINWKGPHFEKTLEAGGQDPSLFTHLVLMDEAEYGYTYHSQFLFSSMKNTGECFARHSEVVKSAWSSYPN